MKRISTKILSMLIAFVMFASVLPNFVLEKAEAATLPYVQTVKANVAMWSKPGTDTSYKGSVKMRQDAPLGTVFTFSEAEYNITSKGIWHKIASGQYKGLWVWQDNITTHNHYFPEQHTTKYVQLGNDYHQVIVTSNAAACSSASKGCTMSSASRTVLEQIQPHSYTSGHLGRCTYMLNSVMCNYVYNYNATSVAESKTYVAKNAGVAVWAQPYADSGSKGTLAAGELVTSTRRVTNAHKNIWIETNRGWIFKDNLTEHASHTWNAQGRCSVAACGAVYKPSEMATSGVYETATNGVQSWSRPYVGDGSPASLGNAGTIVRITADLWSHDFKYWHKTDTGRYILSTDLKAHNHTYKLGVCTATNCGYNFPLKNVKNYTAPKLMETIQDNVLAWSIPYSNSTLKDTYVNSKWVVTVVGEAENSEGNLWYKLSNGTWIYAPRLKDHKHDVKLGMCTYTGCTYDEVNPTTISSTTMITNKANVRGYTRPFTNATLTKTLATQSTMITAVAKVNMSTNILPALFPDWWYKTNDGAWIKGSDLSEHKHTYSAGICTVCKYEYPLAITNLTPMNYETTKADVPEWKRPYANSGLVTTYTTKGTPVVITGQAKNEPGNLWYRTATGTWIYSENVKLSSNPSIGSVVNIASGEYQIYVVDPGGKPIANASVTLGSQTKTTNANGLATFSNPLSTTSLTVTATNYSSSIQVSYSILATRKDTITLAKPGYALVKADMKYGNETINLLTSSKTVNVNPMNPQAGDYGVANFTCNASSGADGIKEYRIVQDGRVIMNSANGQFTNFSLTQLQANKTVYIHVIDNKGTTQVNKKINLSVTNKSADVPVTAEFGKNFSYTLGNSLPWPLAGQKISLNVPTLPLTTRVEGDSLQVGINFNLPTTPSGSVGDTWKEIKSLNSGKFKDFYNKQAISKTGNVTDAKVNPLSFAVCAGGYAEGSINSQYVKGKLFLEVSAKASKEFQYPGPLPLPVVIELSFEGKLNADGTITISKAYGMQGEIEVELKGTIGAYAGTGMAGIASVGVYGNVTLGLEAVFLSPTKPQGVNGGYLTGKMGFKAKMLGNEVWNYAALNFDKWYWLKNGVFLADADSFSANMRLADMLRDYDSYSPMDRSYLDNRSAWNAPNSVTLFDDSAQSVVGFDILQSSTYTDIKPQVVSAGDTIMAAYIDDNATRSANNRTMLVYTLYNKELQEWSEPKPVCDDGTADYGFKLNSDGEKISIVWQNAEDAIQNGETIQEIGQKLELNVAVYDAWMDEFVGIETVTSAGKYPIMPQIAHVNGKTVVAWFENSTNDLTGHEGQNTLHYAYKSDDDYSPVTSHDIDLSDFVDGDGMGEGDGDGIEPPFEPPVVASEPWEIVQASGAQKSVTSLAIGNLMDDAYISFTIDTDGDLTTTDDQIIKMVDLSDNYVMNYTDNAINAVFTKVYGKNALTWYNDGNIYYALDVSSQPQILVRDAIIPNDEYHIISDESGKIAVLYRIKADDSSDAYVIIYDENTGTWGMPVQVTDQEDYIQNFNGAYSDGVIVSIFNQTRVTGDNFAETNNLCTAIIGERNDLTILEVVFDDIGVKPGEENEIVVGVRNSGTVVSKNVIFRLEDGERNLISEKKVAQSMLPGEVVTIETSVNLPQQLEKTTYFLIVEEEDIFDINPDDNTYMLVVGRAALSVNADSYLTDDETTVVVTVTNEGFDSASGSIVLYNDDGTISSILLDNFEPLNHGDSVDCVFVVDENMFAGEMFKSLDIGVITDAEQYTDAYNITFVTVRNIEDTAPLISVDDVDIAEDTGALMAADSNRVSGTISNQSERDLQNAKVFIVAYSLDGEMVEMGSKTVKLNSGESAEFEYKFKPDASIAMVKVFLFDATTHEPLTKNIEILFDTYIYDGTEDDAFIDINKPFEYPVE